MMRQALLLLFLSLLLLSPCSAGAQVALDPNPPESPVKLIFIHHSCGENWLSDDHGGLGPRLAENNYFVSDTNYGWGPDSIGDRTDITDWPLWFTGPDSGRYLGALYTESEQNSWYTRTLPDPGGENEIIMFKSCYPNSNLEGEPDDPPRRGHDLTVANAKAIYRELLPTFASRPDKLFIAVTAPPVQDPSYGRNARAFNRWLVEDWLADYEGTNVAVFDFYNVLTGPENHHRFRDGAIEYTTDRGQDTLYYPDNGDDHPAPAGNRKATDEFVPLLNVAYHRWRGEAGEEAAAPEPAAPKATTAPVETSAPAEPAPEGVDEPIAEEEVQSAPPVAEPLGVETDGPVAEDETAEDEESSGIGSLCPAALGLVLLGLVGAVRQRPSLRHE